MGHKTAAKIFFGSELALWLGYWGSQSYVNVLQRDLESFAALHAGVDAPGKGDQYWIDVGGYLSLDDFNNQKLLERDLEALYADTPENRWQWDSNQNRRDYVLKRFDRLDWKRRVNWVVGGLVLNRLVSAIDVVRLLRKNRDADSLSHKSDLNFVYSHTPYTGEAYRLNLNIVW